MFCYDIGVGQYIILNDEEEELKRLYLKKSEKSLGALVYYSPGTLALSKEQIYTKLFSFSVTKLFQE